MSTTLPRTDIPSAPLGTDVRSSPTPAVRGVRPGRVGWTGAENGTALTTTLGWFSIGLGALELTAPGVVRNLLGLEQSRTTDLVIRAMGLRELGQGLGILANPRSKEWVGLRIPGDMLDMALLAVAIARSDHRGRALATTGAATVIGVLDIVATEGLAERRKAPTPELAAEPSGYTRRSITVNRPIAEVFDFWHDVSNLPRFMAHVDTIEPLGGGRSRWTGREPGGQPREWEAEAIEVRENELIAWQSVGGAPVYESGSVRFEEAPNGRGTVVTVEVRSMPRGGSLGTALLKVARREPGQHLADDLRRMKQWIETGVITVVAHPPRSGNPVAPRSEAEER